MKPKSTALTIRSSLDLYMEQVRRIPVLSREEEKKLALLWFKKRDREAGQKLVISNLRFVVKVAREYLRYGFRLPDLIQEGNLGLLHSIDRFDPRKGYRLISYAVWWIRAYIQAFVLRSWSVVRLGTTRVQRRIIASLQKARQKIASLHADEPVQPKALAAALDVSTDDLNATVNRMQRRDISIDAPVSQDNDAPYGDHLADRTPNAEEQLVEADLKLKVREKLDDIYEDLTPRERYLLDHRLMSDQPVTLEAAGEHFGVTRERVRQIENRLKGRLRGVLAPAFATT
ncbi:MAG: RNA polymerase factor sigma-32 [Pseudomonadota bacterium]